MIFNEEGTSMGVFDWIRKASRKTSVPLKESRLSEKSTTVDKIEIKCPECGLYADDEKIRYNRIIIDCHHCGGHNLRNLAFMRDFIQKEGVFNFKCDECGTFIGVPENVFCSHCKVNRSKDYQKIIDNYSTTHTIKNITVRDGGCSECGISGYQSPVSLGLYCPSCLGPYGVNQLSIDRRLGAIIRCPNCSNSIKIPSTVFCSVCGKLRDNSEKIIYKDIIKGCDERLELDPNDGREWRKKGFALKKLWRNDEADIAFAKARELGYKG